MSFVGYKSIKPSKITRWVVSMLTPMAQHNVKCETSSTSQIKSYRVNTHVTCTYYNPLIFKFNKKYISDTILRFRPMHRIIFFLEHVDTP